MSGRAMWIACAMTPALLALAGADRWTPALLACAVGLGLLVLMLARAPQLSIAVATVVVAAAWAATIGPWHPMARITAFVAAGLLAVLILRRFGAARLRAAAAAALVLLAALASSTVPVTGGAPSTRQLGDLDRYLRREVGRAGVPGVAVAVVDHGAVVFSRGYGRAGRGAMTVDAPVVIGSTTKSITAVAVLQLVEDGRVELDEPVRRYLPWFDPIDRRARHITVRQLLVDTSGIPTWAGWSGLAGDGHAHRADVRKLVAGLQLSSPPGDRFQYSNVNYIVLGQLVEAVTGESYADVVDQRVFTPLGMTHTRAAAAPDGATPHRFWFAQAVPSHLPYLEVGLPAGAVTSTADDLARYVRAELSTASSTVLDPDTLATSHAPAVRAEGFGVPSGRHYAMGWYIGTVAGEKAVFHSGDVFDSSSALVMLPDRDLGLVVVANSESVLTPIAKTLADGATATMVGAEPAGLAAQLTVNSLVILTAAGAILGFAVSRARRLRAGRPRTRRELVRLVVVDLVVPAALLLGLPLAFSRWLDRAETIGPVAFWHLLVRGAPDVALLLLAALLLRCAAAAATLVRPRSARGDS